MNRLFEELNAHDAITLWFSLSPLFDTHVAVSVLGCNISSAVCTVGVSAVGLWSDSVGADDAGTDAIRRHRPLRDVSLPEGRLPNSTANQLPR